MNEVVIVSRQLQRWLLLLVRLLLLLLLFAMLVG